MWMLAADDSGAFETSTPVGAVALAIALAAALAMLWLHRSTRPNRPTAGAPTIDLRPETPAVVDLLTGGFDVEDDAMPATVIDLAARRWFTIEDVGGDRIVLRLRQRAHDDPLTRYEARVMDHIRKHEVDGIVPAPVLTLGPQGVSERWFRSFRREVTAHARALGLCRRRWDLAHVIVAWVAVAVAFAPAIVVAYTVGRTDDPTGWGSAGNLLLGASVAIGVILLVHTGRISGSDAQVDTPAGLDAASHWMGVRAFYRSSGRFEDKPAPSVALWERTLAYATAMGLAPLVQRQIPFETEHDRHAWSLATGQWRRVKVSYRAVRPGWGASPWSVAFLGLLQTAFFGTIAYFAFYVASTEIDIDSITFTDDQRRRIGLGALIVAVVAAMACLYGVAKLLLGLSDLFARRTIEGELVRRRQVGSTSSSSDDKVRWYLAIDTGRTDRIRALRVGPGIYRQVSQGARVRATVTPRLGYVSWIETLAAPRSSTVHASTATDHGAPDADTDVDLTVRGLLTRSRERRQGNLVGMVTERLERMTDRDGRPVLDRRAADGTTLRDQLAALSGQAGTGEDPTPRLQALLDSLDGDERADHDPRPGADDDRHRADQHGADRRLPPPTPRPGV